MAVWGRTAQVRRAEVRCAFFFFFFGVIFFVREVLRRWCGFFGPDDKWVLRDIASKRLKDWG